MILKKAFIWHVDYWMSKKGEQIFNGPLLNNTNPFPNEPQKQCEYQVLDLIREERIWKAVGKWSENGI